MGCPDANLLEQYLGARLSPADAAQVEAHLDSCPECRRLVAALSKASPSLPGAEAIGPTIPPSTPPPPAPHPDTDPSPTASHANAVELPARLGEVVVGKYRIDRVLGAGGMGVVVAARHLQLSQQVALKFMRPALAKDSQAVARFLREARAAAALHSDHVTRILDIGTTEGGQPFIVMEYLEGEDLAALLKRTGRMPVADAVAAVLQALETVGEAHAIGIIHRDLKPGNLFLTRRVDGTPCIKVLDFGLSKISRGIGDSSDFTATLSRSMMGSPLYMAPEQLMAQPTVGPRSDLYAVGCILYELLSGQTPFCGNTLPELIAQVLHGTLKPVRSLCPEVPEALDALVSKCLERDPDQRIATVAELVEGLMPFAPATAVPGSSRAALPPPAVPAVPAAPDAPAAEPRSSRARWIAVAAAAALVAVVGLALTLRAQKPSDLQALDEAMAKEMAALPDAAAPAVAVPPGPGTPATAVAVDEKPPGEPAPSLPAAAPTSARPPPPARKPATAKKPRSPVFDSRQ